MSRLRYDGATLLKLTAHYGHRRALSIVNGDDEATNADIAAWRRLCASGVPLNERQPTAPNPGLPLEERVMWWAAKGCEPNIIAQRVGKPLVQVQAIMAAHA
jgi:hypothetical protein